LTFQRALGAAIFAFAALTPAAASAHPHVWVTARAEIVFDDAGQIMAIRHIWQFDEAFSAYAVQGLDANNDGGLTRAELAPLAQINVESLAEYRFFTWLYVRGEDRPLLPPQEYWLDIYGARLTLFYTLPLAEPAAVADEVVLEVTDPEYFVAFTFADENPAMLIDARPGCVALFEGAQELDEEAARLLAAIPADQRNLPPELAALTMDRANAIRVRC